MSTTQKVTASIPVVDPVTARRGRFLISRHGWDEICWWAERLETEMRARNVQLKAWRIVATQHTAPKRWALYVLYVNTEEGPASPA